MTRIPWETKVAEDQDPDRDLVEAARRGPDREGAFFELFQRYSGAVDEYFRRKRFPPEERPDLIQTTFLRAFMAIMEVRIPFRGWLFLMASHVYRDEIRSRRTERRDGVIVPLSGPAEIAVETPSASADPQEETLAMERADRVRRALLALPSRMRHALEMYLRGDKVREIALVMGITAGAVKAHLHQARERLRQELGADFGEPGF